MKQKKKTKNLRIKEKVVHFFRADHCCCSYICRLNFIVVCFIKSKFKEKNNEWINRKKKPQKENR